MPRPPTPKSKSRCFLIATLLWAVASRGAVAAPDEASEPARAQARALMQQGAQQMDDRQYDKAVESFSEAYRLVPSPKVLYNLGIAYLSVARYADALQALEGFLKDAKDVPAATEETARRHIDDLRTKVVALEIRSNRPGAALSLDGRDLGAVTFDHPLTIDPGPHQLHARAGTDAADQAFTAQAGQPMTVTLTFAAPAPVPPVADVTRAPEPMAPAASLAAGPPPVYRRPWFWVAAGGGAAIAVAVILVLVLSHTDYPSVDQKVAGP